MKAIDYFKRVRRAEGELKSLRARLQHYQDLGLTITSSGGNMGRQRGASRVEAAAVGSVDTFDSLQSRIREYSAIVKDAEKVIEQIHQERYRQILTFRYLCGWSFRSISDELEYNDPNSVYRAHGWALSEAQKILNREVKGNEKAGS